ncbi:hypothetical protein FO519_008273 [Halicephalobus sp. NKZ332]|nr:hypothetical protein FO519_008273 [Halicephalobus sp. NKZ332]
MMFFNGAGRSGAYLALDANLELLKRTGQIDLYEYSKTMINARPNLIDSVDQYIFMYEVIAEAVLCNIQPIQIHELKERSTMYRSKKDREKMELQDSHENKLLTMLTPMLKIGDCAGGHRMENRNKNRDVMVVPPDHARPYLQTLHGESKDYTYINAVEVDGFTRKSEYIVTEWPKQQTIDSFWTLIFDHGAHTVVNLTNAQNSKVYPQFIHTKGKQNYGPFVVEVLNYQQYPAMTSTMVKIQKRVGLSYCTLLGKKPVFRRPTLKGFLSEEAEEQMRQQRERRNRSCPPGQSFRFKSIYRGKMRSSSVITREGVFRQLSNASVVSHIRHGGAKVAELARSASRMARELTRRNRKEKKFVQPRSEVLEHFDKVLNLWLIPTEPLPLHRVIDRGKPGSPRQTDKTPNGKTPHSNGKDQSEVSVNRLRADREIQQLLRYTRSRDAKREPSEQIEKLTFMISEIMATGATQQQLEAEIRVCCILQVRMWPLENKVPLSTSGLIELIKMTRSWRKRAPDRPEIKPTIVMSHNGYSRCGIFIAANVCIDQMDLDNEVDVFHVVKMIRINRPQLIDMKDEYKYLYDLMLHWYMTNPEYRASDNENTPTRDSIEEDQEKLGNGNLLSNRASIRSNNTPSPKQKQAPIYLN